MRGRHRGRDQDGQGVTAECDKGRLGDGGLRPGPADPDAVHCGKREEELALCQEVASP